MVLILLILILNQSILPFVSANSTTYFARALFDNVYLYKNPIDINDYSNIFFEIPKTYFVELLNSANEDFYFAKYENFSGYVKKGCVQPVVGTPQNPYLNNLNFRVFAELSRDMRSEPSTNYSSTQITYIPLMSRNLTYYGQIEGDSLIEGRTNIWYYCKYSGEKDYYGYIYSDFCDELNPIPLNNEYLQTLDTPIFTNTSYSETNSIPVKSNTLGIIVAILCVPALVFAYMIIKGKNFVQKEKTTNKEVIDY